MMHQKTKSKGFTLLEMVFTLTLITMLVAVIIFLYVTVLKSWDRFGRRSDLRTKLFFALERVVRDVRKANAIDVVTGVNNNEYALRFTLNECTPSCANNSYIYYLYNASDSWSPVPLFNQPTYALMRTSLTGGINGTFTYGSGELIVSGLKPPPGYTLITKSGNIAQINLVEISSNETMQIYGSARPRNA